MAYRDLPDADEMPPLFHKWLERLPAYEDKPEHTVRAYGQAVRRIVSFAGIAPKQFAPKSLDQKTLTDAVAAMRKARIKKATLNQSLAALKSFYDFCVETDEIKQAPANIPRIRKLTKLDAPPVNPDYYMPSDIRRLYEEAARDGELDSRVRWAVRDLAMCSFLAVLGIRSAELIDANIAWVSNERLIDADDSAPWMFRVEGKGKKIRRLPLSDELLQANYRWQVERRDRFGPSGPDDPLFVTNDGTRFNYQRLRYWLRLLNREAGVASSHTLHSLRHSTGVQLAAEGAPMNVIQSLLGHANLNTTGVYTAIAGGELIEMLGRSGANTQLGEVLNAIPPGTGGRG